MDVTTPMENEQNIKDQATIRELHKDFEREKAYKQEIAAKYDALQKTQKKLLQTNEELRHRNAETDYLWSFKHDNDALKKELKLSKANEKLAEVCSDLCGRDNDGEPLTKKLMSFFDSKGSLQFEPLLNVVKRNNYDIRLNLNKTKEQLRKKICEAQKLRMDLEDERARSKRIGKELEEMKAVYESHSVSGLTEVVTMPDTPQPKKPSSELENSSGIFFVDMTESESTPRVTKIANPNRPKENMMSESFFNLEQVVSPNVTINTACNQSILNETSDETFARMEKAINAKHQKVTNSKSGLVTSKRSANNCNASNGPYKKSKKFNFI
uniref:Uncharacterized protein n=1 Tax=Rhabditophanes sp. KR3021 TaxID=114890 RepID=A0AC35TKL2_9BILA